MTKLLVGGNNLLVGESYILVRRNDLLAGENNIFFGGNDFYWLLLVGELICWLGEMIIAVQQSIQRLVSLASHNV